MTRYAHQEGAYEIDTIPAQPQIAHCHGFFVKSNLRGKGNGHVLKRHQLERLVNEHYDYATATVDAGNFAQKHILTQAGFRRLDAFANTKICSITELWGRAITKEQP